jgi:hypothetical protein
MFERLCDKGCQRHELRGNAEFHIRKYTKNFRNLTRSILELWYSIIVSSNLTHPPNPQIP